MKKNKKKMERGTSATVVVTHLSDRRFHANQMQSILMAYSTEFKRVKCSSMSDVVF